MVSPSIHSSWNSITQFPSKLQCFTNWSHIEGPGVTSQINRLPGSIAIIASLITVRLYKFHIYETMYQNSAKTQTETETQLG